VAFIPDQNEILNILQHSPVFRGIEPDRLKKKFAPAMETITLGRPSGESSFLIDDYFYIVLRGMVHGFVSDEYGERRVSIFVLKEGDGFDVLSLLGERDRKLVYSCLGRKAICLQVPLPTMRKWIREEPQMSKALLLYLAHLLAELEELVFDLSLYDTSTRLVKLLLRHAKTNIHGNHGPSILYHLTHEELASLIGSVRVVVSRQVQKLKKMSLIEVEKGKIIIRDLKLLMDLIEKRKKEIKK